MGEGNDVGDGGAGNDLIEGEAGADVVAGGAGDDRVYAGSTLTLADAITQGEAATPGSGGPEWGDGGVGKDVVIGGATADVLMGGAGQDVLVGGGGDDILHGDSGRSFVQTGWSVTREVGIYVADNFGDTLGTRFGADLSILSATFLQPALYARRSPMPRTPSWVSHGKSRRWRDGDLGATAINNTAWRKAA